MKINFTRIAIALSIACCSLPVNLKSQITITKNDMPKSGDTIRYSIVLTASGTDFTQTGANHNWDFTGLKHTAQDIYSYKNFSATPYLFYTQFLGAIGLKTADSVPLGILTLKQLYTFYKSSSSRWTAEGSGFSVQGVPLASDYADADIIYNFPLNYNQNDSDKFRVTTTIPTIGSFQQSGKRYNTVDGWGKISTPYASNINCIRIKSVVNEVDSVKTTFTSVGFPFTTVTYKWLSNTEKIPMLEVSGTEIGGTFIPASIRFRDNYRGSSSSQPGPKANFTVDKTTGLTNTDTFYFTNLTQPSAGVIYQWNITPSASVSYIGSTSSSANPKVKFTQSGTYTVKLTATNVNGSDDTTVTDMITITDPNTGIGTIGVQQSVLYPNPAGNILHISATGMEGAAYIISDISGKTIASGIVTALQIPADKLAPGTYTLFLQQAGQLPVMQSFIKQ